MNDKQREAVKEYLEDCNDNEMMEVVSAINSYSGGLEELEYFDMAMFDEFMDGKKPLEIAQEVSRAGDDFDPYEKYFRWDSCGNLISADSIEYDDYELDDIIDAIDDVPRRELPAKLRGILRDNDYYDEDEDEEDDDEDM